MMEKKKIVPSIERAIQGTQSKIRDLEVAKNALVTAVEGGNDSPAITESLAKVDTELLALQHLREAQERLLERAKNHVA
jgi:hypothetical protein